VVTFIQLPLARLTDTHNNVTHWGKKEKEIEKEKETNSSIDGDLFWLIDAPL